MSMNPLKYLGGLVLEIGAVIAALAFLPALGGSPAALFTPASQSTQLAPATSNQVFYDAQTTRVMNPAALDQQPARTAWQNEFAPQPNVAQQRFVEGMLDHNSQRAMDTAARVWNRGDELLPPDLRVRREVSPPAPSVLPISPLPPQELRLQESPPPSYYAPRRPFDDRY